MVRAPRIMILPFLVLAYLSKDVFTQELTSPCPNVFEYEQQTERDKWYGIISAKTTEELSGLWISIKLDSKAEFLGNWFGETYSTDNQEFRISNPDYTLEAGPPVAIRFFVKYNLSRKVPRLQVIRLNGKIICSDDDVAFKPTVPKLHISKPNHHRQPSIGAGLSYEPSNISNSNDAIATINRPSSHRNSNNYDSYGRPISSSTTEDNVYNKPYGGTSTTVGSHNRPSSDSHINSNKYHSGSGERDTYPSQDSDSLAGLVTQDSRPIGGKFAEDMVNGFREPSGTVTNGRLNGGSSGESSSSHSNNGFGRPSNRPSQNKIGDNGYNNGPNQNDNRNVGPTENLSNSGHSIFGKPSQDTNSEGTISTNDHRHNIHDSEEDFFEGDFNIHRPSSGGTRPKPVGVGVNKPIECGTVAYRPRPLITHGQDTVPGEWPWHSAIYHTKGIQLVYICGASLISDRHVMTAAHCVSRPRSNKKVSTDSILVYFGKYNLKTFGPETQDRDVSEIHVHPDFNYTMYYNDIAIIKLSRPVKITDFVRPCCLWSEDTNLENVVDKLGTVIGWGFDENKIISEKLMQAKMPIVSTIKCIYSNRDFFARFTFDKNFCAGFLNGTSVCNGDSGGSMVFPKKGTSGQSTVWQIRGIVSVGVALQSEGVCDTSQYVIFTDAAKHLSWINRILST